MKTLLSRRRLLVAAGAPLLAPFAARPALAQSAWPTRPVRMIINLPPGSSPDVLGRALAQPLQEGLGQSIVIETRTGVGGAIGAEAAAKATDGHTILMTAGSVISVNPFVNPLPFDPNRDLVPVAAVARVALFLVMRADLPPKNLKEFVAYLKANPGRLSYGSPGNGSSPHVVGEMFKAQAGVFSVHIPYRGSAPALQDLLGGQIDYAFDPGIAFPHVRSGKLRMLAVPLMQRSSQFPDVPTLHESGFPGFDGGTTHSVYMPAGTPADVVARVNREVNRALTLPAVRTAITGIGAEPTPMTPQQLAQVMAEDAKRYSAIIRERKIKPD
ncbi:MAG: tripartite tricarboxylate transporter substrate binding protein [Burkholderiales bacterium]|nr:tripartite tricarboxylate transporter substrate binding protein [Burkholderiales bacterium]